MTGILSSKQKQQSPEKDFADSIPRLTSASILTFALKFLFQGLAHPKKTDTWNHDLEERLCVLSRGMWPCDASCRGTLEHSSPTPVNGVVQQRAISFTVLLGSLGRTTVPFNFTISGFSGDFVLKISLAFYSFFLKSTLKWLLDV